MIHQIRKSSEAPRTPGVWRRPQELSPPPEDLLSFAAPRDALNSSVHGVQTPNCIRRTIYDVVALDYEKVTVFIDATVVARPNIHLGEYSSFTPAFLFYS
uniref:Isochorismatase-like domain-containing protein n=1 Tax=Aegilops tauschii subsp. strangulata TaxID=200361 RepID=A0A452Y8H9_AEGTS